MRIGHAPGGGEDIRIMTSLAKRTQVAEYMRRLYARVDDTPAAISPAAPAPESRYHRLQIDKAVIDADGVGPVTLQASI